MTTKKTTGAAKIAVANADIAQATGTAMVLARSMDDALVILHDAALVGTRQYMQKSIHDATRALMSQDRTVAMRLRRMAKEGTRIIPDQPPITPEIVTLCGSTRFMKEFQRWNFELTTLNRIVLSVAFHYERDLSSHKDKPVDPTPEQKKLFDELHKRRIDISDSILIINPKLKAKDKYGYIGQSTAEEIIYASMLKKPIASLEDLPPMEEIIKVAGRTLTGKEAIA